MVTMTFTPEQWARHERFVEMVRAAKQRKEAWVKKMQAQWEAEDQMRKEAAAKEQTLAKVDHAFGQLRQMKDGQLQGVNAEALLDEL